MKTAVAIIGAGPAGLTAGYLLAKNEIEVTILEADPVYVGGISRTARYKGFHFDIGGHRFFSKSKAVDDLWNEILPNDMLERPRSSRIFYDGKFFAYPLKPVEALLKLGIFRSLLCVLSWLRAQLFPVLKPRNFEQWVSKNGHSIADHLDNFLRYLGNEEFFAVRRGGGDHDTVGIDDCRGATKRNAIVLTHAIGGDDITLVLDCAGQRQHPKVLYARKRPGRGNDEDVYLILDGQRSIELGKAKVITNS